MATKASDVYPGGDYMDPALIATTGKVASSSVEKVESPVVDSTSSTFTGLLNGATGLLSKVADTALDVWALREAGKANANIGSAYPTGQVDPATVRAQVMAETQTEKITGQNMQKYIPWLIGGGVALVIVFGGIVLLNSRK